ncbi:MAG: hypothetical protein WCY21_00850 [Candidatus Cloacimonadaceae bacterium]|jgi:hypothetical protein|nr:hypothetical protein [Candidatus Cloacimonadota bacterium]MDX9950170.1 hypothetical protein [Candidatus Syntrophosphaera sp.]
MKKILFMIALLALALGLFAHPADDIRASYKASTQTLEISFDHKVKDSNVHFINSIEIHLNGDKIITQHTRAQIDNTGGSFLYKIPNLQKNDKLEIILNCNKGGKKSTTMILK